METNYNPYVIIPSDVAGKVVDALRMGKLMAKDKYPHLESGFDFIIKQYENTALSFIGSQNIPKEAKFVYKSSKM